MANELAEEGMRFLSRKDRELHPAAQIQKLRRIAVRALSDADWRDGVPSKQNPRPPRRLDFSAEENAYIAGKRRRAAAAVEAMLKLNAEHKLYPVKGKS